MLVFFVLLFAGSLPAQVSPPVPATTANHSKQVIGYITQWDAWKDVAGLVPKGGYNQLNVDYSQYTILNFSFFGVARDGSLHSGDFRNKNIYQVGAVQNPAALLNTDIYSSWDLFLLQGELDILYNISDGSYAYRQGYRNEGAGWKNINTNETGSFPLSIHKEGGAPGLIELAHQKGVKVMASVGGWSMCKHFPEVAADATKRAKFVSECQKLMAMGFDGIDFDWEYPNDPGMNIEHYGTVDYTNFAVLVEAVRAAIGTTKLITAAFSASSTKLQGFDWPRLNNSMNYYNMMTYDFNGGWSNKAGHNAPLYDYPGAEYPNFSVNALVQGLRQLGVNMSKVNIGAPFYGRGVITSGAAALNGATVKRAETVQPDGPIQTCADYTNWTKDLWDGTPNYAVIQKTTGAGSGWTDYWDDVAKVPYKTKGNFFLSYDNERSIGEKAQYIKDNSLAGIIVWQVYGDMINMTTSTVPKGKLIYCPNTISPLVNKINAVFASGTPGNVPPVVNLTSPTAGTTYIAPAIVNIEATASDADGTVKKVEFYNGTNLLGTDSTSPYQYTWSNVPAGNYSITAKATDNASATTTSTAVAITVNTSGGTTDTGKVIVGYWHNWGTTSETPPYVRLRDVNPYFNVVQVAFGVSASDYATISFTPENATPAEFIADIQLLQSQGRKVLLSLGGQNGTLVLNDATKKQAFITSMKAILDQYNFDGFDIDIEGGTSLQLDNGDNNFTNPTTPKVVNLISAVREIINYRKGLGKRCWLTMAPETYYVQTAYGSNYSPLVGAYLPLIYGLRDLLTFIHPQYYNTGSVMGMDNKVYSQATPDFITSMTDMLLFGFPVAGTGMSFPALREDQVAFGLPAVPAAAPSGGYLAPPAVKQALDYLTKGISFGGQYILKKPSGYPGLRGIMTWSLNWDKTNNNEFATNYHDYFFGTTGNNPPSVRITSPVNNASFTAPANIIIDVTATDSDGSIKKVEFYNGSTLIATDSVLPYSYTWNNVAAGNYNLTAKATDNLNASTVSAIVAIVVNTPGGNCTGIPTWSATQVYTGGNQVVYNNKLYQAKWWTQGDQPDLNSGDSKPWTYVRDCSGTGPQPPTVSITSPANNAVFTAPASVNIQATAADADGTVKKVEFYNGTTLLSTDSVSPYAYTWSNVAAGSYSITAKATDNSNTSTTSTVVNIVVNGTGGGNCTGIPAYQLYPKIYKKGDRVVYNNVLYESQSDNLYNVTPGNNEWWWKTIASCSAAASTSSAQDLKTNATSDADKFSIYPNPVHQELQLQTAESWKGSLIRILDLSGRQLLAVKPTNNRINVAHLAPGTYVLIAISNGKTITKRFVIAGK
ncbi:glycosyl hydrolase family 18 protein [Pseudoflavitalea sp. G-6-1-2]|uniref:glycosyl hydrolase family 18 protein n=1 Tax=Pseudoflavitalea sp. G-6-1-2 TaxID=2728841 RepID=UPI001F0E0718|nr:glycosyl hydrolase family 18 protein [Pseudoflavitalea sp. G-6-1-2]